MPNDLDSGTMSDESLDFGQTTSRRTLGNVGRNCQRTARRCRREGRKRVEVRRGTSVGDGYLASCTRRQHMAGSTRRQIIMNESSCVVGRTTRINQFAALYTFPVDQPLGTERSPPSSRGAGTSRPDCPMAHSAQCSHHDPVCFSARSSHSAAYLPIVERPGVVAGLGVARRVDEAGDVARVAEGERAVAAEQLRRAGSRTSTASGGR